jgi:hypothetical protein
MEYCVDRLDHLGQVTVTLCHVDVSFDECVKSTVFDDTLNSYVALVIRTKLRAWVVDPNENGVREVYSSLRGSRPFLPVSGEVEAVLNRDPDRRRTRCLHENVYG